jgi:hypothetical protein
MAMLTGAAHSFAQSGPNKAGTSAAPPPAVCSVEDFKLFTATAPMADRQMVGLRNSRSEIGGWNYIGELDFAAPVNLTFDLGASAEKLIQYEPVVLLGTKLLVSTIPRLSWGDAKPDNRNATRPAAGASATPANAEIPVGNPVLDSDEAFIRRGYLLSATTAIMLRGYLQDVKDLWIDGPAGINADALKEFASRMHKSSATLTLADVFQGEHVGLKVSKFLPNWSRKPLTKLTAVESREALTFVEHYAGGLKQVIEAFMRLNARGVPSCTLLFAPDALFGFP